MGLLASITAHAVLFGLGFCYASLVLLRLIFKTLQNPGGEKFWHVKKRNTPPSCLSDESLGTHKYIQLKEVKLHYVEKGDNTKPLMLFIHGFPEFWYSWRYQLKEFSKDYWTIAVDMRGYGDSDKPSSVSRYRIEYLVNDIKELIEALGRKKCILVAHDWGGAIAWQFVKKYPEMLEKYIIMGAPCPKRFRNYLLSNRKQFLMSWYIFFFQMPYLPELLMRSYDMEVFSRLWKPKNSDSEIVTDEVTEAYKYTFGKPGAFTGPINYYRANMLQKALINASTDNEGLTGLYIMADGDAYLSPDLLEWAKEQVPNLETHLLKDASHFLQQEKPEALNEVMHTFLKK